ncbi:hypothetical protein [Kyrpidia sp.]|uniref:hypothetical protein n=1 Tax=Kyrpidia sp. TaxID=2073077 RepID=UPI0025858864|nr:hypothetical protein [Kyrpidia sp.]MCL6577183.1 hypothetical protein [Kyrpidia sp.]
MKKDTWHGWVEEYLAGGAFAEGYGRPERTDEDGARVRARETLGAWLAGHVEEVAGEEPDRGKLRESVEEMLYRLALSGAGSAELDRHLGVLKAFSAWCVAAGKLPFDFAGDIPWIGETDPGLVAHIRGKWALNDRFYGIEENG